MSQNLDAIWSQRPMDIKSIFSIQRWLIRAILNARKNSHVSHVSIFVKNNLKLENNVGNLLEAKNGEVKTHILKSPFLRHLKQSSLKVRMVDALDSLEMAFGAIIVIPMLLWTLLFSFIITSLRLFLNEKDYHFLEKMVQNIDHVLIETINFIKMLAGMVWLAALLPVIGVMHLTAKWLTKDMNDLSKSELKNIISAGKQVQVDSKNSEDINTRIDGLVDRSECYMFRTPNLIKKDYLEVLNSIKVEKSKPDEPRVFMRD